MADAIRFVLTNMPAILFVAALAIPTTWRHGPQATRYLAWLLLLSVGVDSFWGGFFHVFFPQMAAASIGWQVSPFQYEIGVSDLAIGIAAIAAFWQGFGFRAAVVVYTVLFYIGVAVGHFREGAVRGRLFVQQFRPAAGADADQDRAASGAAFEGTERAC